jgi:hypothetical protein
MTRRRICKRKILKEDLMFGGRGRVERDNRRSRGREAERCIILTR